MLNEIEGRPVADYAIATLALVWETSVTGTMERLIRSGLGFV